MTILHSTIQNRETTLSLDLCPEFMDKGVVRLPHFYVLLDDYAPIFSSLYIHFKFNTIFEYQWGTANSYSFFAPQWWMNWVSVCQSFKDCTIFQKKNILNDQFQDYFIIEKT